MSRRLWFVSVLLSMLPLLAQAQWSVVYATSDDDSNGTGNRTSGVGVIHENMYIALITRYVGSTYQSNYMIPYVNADSTHGRRYTYGYGAVSTGIFNIWSDGAFDQIPIHNCQYIIATPDSFIYAPSNDPQHNLFVFKYTSDTITTVPVNGVYPREETGMPSLYGVALDKNGNVYVCVDTSIGNAVDVKIYPPITQWALSHQTSALQTIDLPDGIYKGIAVSPDGGAVFVSDYQNRKVLKYTGSIATGYTHDTGFDFTLGVNDTAEGLHVGPLGLNLLNPNNILCVACAAQYGPTGTGSSTYTYGRVYLLNPNTGALISPDISQSVVDQALWDFTMTGSYEDNNGGQVGGYPSVYAVQSDEKGYLYLNTYYGWAIEKWQYNGTLPVFTSVERIGNVVPEGYRLMQNYPNPFNPATTIEFEVPTSGQVNLTIVNMLGEQVSTLVNENKTPGRYRVAFDARSLPSGTYFYTLRTAGSTQTKKMLLVR
jgi:hypothetical protein